jgi:hypothetical protein
MDAYKKFVWGGTVGAALLIIPFLVYFFFIKTSPEPQAPQEPVQEIVQKEVPDAPIAEGALDSDKDLTAELPFETDLQLNASDEPVRELLRDSSNHPEFLRWLKSSGLIRRGVAIIDNIANGYSPVVHFQPILKKPTGGFSVIDQEEKIILDPKSFKRYNFLTGVLTSVKSEMLVYHYRQLLPLLEKAYGELGFPGKTFRHTLAQAVDVLLEIEPLIPEGPIQLEEKVAVYAYADPQLEQLNDAQKHLLRMGPQNARLILDKLKEIKALLKQE